MSASNVAWTSWIAAAVAAAITMLAAAAKVAASPIRIPAMTRQPWMSRNGSPGCCLVVSSQVQVPRTAGDPMILTASTKASVTAERMSMITWPA